MGDAFFSTRTVQGLGIVKPYGYAGDFEFIDRIYTQWLSPDPRLTAWDVYLQQHKAPKAVRNRKVYFLNLLRGYLSTADHLEIRVLSVGCGPARECAEFFAQSDFANTRVHFHLLDQDPRALAYARTVNAQYSVSTTFHQGKAHAFSCGHTFDFIWSAGLFDYLSDHAFSVLTRNLYRRLSPGGLLTIGNFAPTNPSRDYMEFGDWYLRYRTAEDLYDLALKSGAVGHVDQLCVDSEPEGTNLFLHVSRPV
jgi:SAM-dependent methyltransferase